MLLDVRHITHSYAALDVLQDVSIQIDTGELVSIVGPNGAGKSTLLRCLARLLRPSAGSVHLNSTDLSTLTQQEVARQICYTPQHLEQITPISIEDFVLMGRYPHLGAIQRPSADDWTLVNDALVKTDLDEIRSRALTALSAGELRRAVIAASLAQDPALLLLDEPTTFLDPRQRTNMLELLKTVKARASMSTLLVTHDINVALALSDRIVALKAGCVHFDGTPADFIGDDTIELLFETSFLRIPRPESSLPIIVSGVY